MPAPRRATTPMPHLFVYGTLKRRGSNHGQLAGQKFLGEAHTTPGYTLYALGDYPGLVVEADDRHGVKGELWAVDEDALARLDEFEGVPEGLYRRETVPLIPPHARIDAEAFIYARSIDGCPRIGDCWIT